MDIKSIKCYQAVNFEGSSHNFFTIVPLAGKTPYTLMLIKDILSVEVKSSKDHIIVPLTNISSIQLWGAEDDIKAAKSEAERQKTTAQMRPQDIKRPK